MLAPTLGERAWNVQNVLTHVVVPIASVIDLYGWDYSSRPLVDDFNNSRYVLIGHSFGGATVRVFSELIKNGSQEEIANTDPSELLNFFRGGMGDDLLAVVTLAAPTNGTTAYDMYGGEAFDLSQIDIPEEYIEAGDNVSKATKAEKDGRADWDYAAYDMHIDNALALNERITTFDDVYYLITRKFNECKADRIP